MVVILIRTVIVMETPDPAVTMKKQHTLITPNPNRSQFLKKCKKKKRKRQLIDIW